ncbi:hypothetical protein [Paraflavitalea pollutisoli]|uniref:hypothetical protein n=1 Tax=Paraflavitalea pollutisoli TaxID=3034143 RepID=UPI0023EC0E70|nr:hypothetical protein [Paraflavitalea sp. H1-2-19X]
MKRSLLTVCYLVFSSIVLQAQRYWVGATSTDWNTTTNWSTAPGGAGGASVPGSNDAVFFDRVTPNAALLNVTTTVQSLTFSGGALTLGSAGRLTVSNNTSVTGGAITLSATAAFLANGVFTISNGSIDADGSAISAANTFTMSGGTISLGAGSFTAASTFSLTNGAFNVNSGTLQVANNSFQVTGGTLNAGSGNVLIGNNMTIATPLSVVAGTSTFTFNGAGQQDVVIVTANDPGTVVFYNLIINKAGTSRINFNTTAAADTFQINNLLTLTSGQFSGGGFIKIEKDVTTGTSFSGSSIPIACTGPNPSTVTLAAPLAVTGVTNFVGIIKSSPNVVVNVYRGAGAVDDTIRIGNFDARFIVRRGIIQFPNNNPIRSRFRSLEIEPGGTFNAPNNYLYNTGEHINSGGVFNANGGTYVFYYPSIPTGTNLTANRETFNNLIFDNQSQFTPGLADTLVVNGTLTFRSGTMQGQTGSAFDAKGNINFEAGANPTAGVSNLLFTGTGDQTLTFAPTRIDAWNGSFIVNKPSGNLILGSPVVMDQFADGNGPKFIRFTRGIVMGSSTNYLSFKNQAVAYEASNLSFVDGPVQFSWYADFVFPIGNQGFYAPAKITSPATDVVTAQYFHVDPGPLYNDNAKQPSLQKISDVEYWMINKTGTASNPFVSLSYVSGRSGTITAPAQLRVSRWNGSLWEDAGNVAESPNYVRTTNAVPSFSPFTLASINSLTNPLPVHLISFRGESQQGAHLLDWVVDNEVNFDEYVVERSKDGNTFSDIGRVKAIGEGGQHAYNFRDAGTNSTAWYRLRLVDKDGRFEYSRVIQVGDFGDQLQVKVLKNPGPGNYTLNIFSGAATVATIRVTDGLGKLVSTGQLLLGRGMNAYYSNAAALAQGIYFIEVTTTRKERQVVRYVVAN